MIIKKKSFFLQKLEYLFKKLKSLTVNDILDEGLHEFLRNFIEDISIVYQDLEKNILKVYNDFLY